MSALYAILSFLAFVSGLAAVYRVFERRSSTPKSSQSKAPVATIQPESANQHETQTAPVPLSASQPVVEPPSTEPSQPTVTGQTATMTAQPTVPDPWLTEASGDAGVEVLSPEPSSPVVSEPSNPVGVVSVPSTSEVLVGAIAQAGRSGQLQQTSYLKRYVNHADSQVRAAVATALGQLASNRHGSAVTDLIPLLGKLCQDSNVNVRRAAVVALGQVQSPNVLPLLHQAQRQPDRSISQAAAQALQKLKLHYYPKPAPAAAKARSTKTTKK